LLGLAALILVVGCIVQTRNQQNQVWEKQLFAMDTIMTFTACGPHGEAAVSAAMREVQRLDALLSTGDANSEISQLNAAGGGAVSEDTRQLLSAAQSVREETHQCFDCTIYPLMELWGFPTGEYHVPTDKELAETLSLVDGSKVVLDGNDVTLGEGQKIDLGGIAKGYASARIMDIYREQGVRAGMVSLGGNVQTLGEKPDGTAWRIAVRDPEGVEPYLGVLSVRDRAVVTSGGYERYFEQDGKTYIHILDPHTGRPAESDLLSVTVISADGTAADALSTALFVMGREDATAFWRDHKDVFDLILVDNEGNIYITSGISAEFETERACTVI